MMRIATAAVEIFYCKMLCQITEEYSAANKKVYHFSRHDTFEELLDAFTRGTDYDLCILDLDADRKSALDTARQIHQRYANVGIIFLADQPDHAPRAFEVGALRYILKKEVKVQFPEVYAYFDSDKMHFDKGYYKVDVKGSMEWIPYQNILYVKKENKNLLFVLCGGKVFSVRQTVAEVYHELEPQGFILIDRGCIVNMDNIRRLSRDVCVLDNEIKLPVSQERFRDLKKRVADHMKTQQAAYE